MVCKIHLSEGELKIERPAKSCGSDATERKTGLNKEGDGENGLPDRGMTNK